MWAPVQILRGLQLRKESPKVVAKPLILLLLTDLCWVKAYRLYQNSLYMEGLVGFVVPFEYMNLGLFYFFQIIWLISGHTLQSIDFTSIN